MRKLLVLLVVAALSTPAPSLASGAGSVSGRVLVPEGSASAKAVWVATPNAPDRPERAPVDATGAFRFDAIPEGVVHLAVETSEGLYEVETPIAIAPGATRQVQLALRGGKDTSAPADTNTKRKKTGGFWDNPLTATLVVLGAAIVVGVGVDQLTDDDNNASAPASPSTP